MVRELIESRMVTISMRLAMSLDDQKAFQSLSLDMLRHLELTRGEELEQPADEDGEDQDGEDETEDGEDDQDSGEQQQPRK